MANGTRGKSFKVRVPITIGANVIRAIFSFCVGALIARSLGPASYGDFSFLLGSFTAFTDFVNMASSTAFYTFISQRQRGRRFFLYYSGWVLIQWFLLLFLVWFLPEFLREKLWLGHPIDLVVLALSANFIMNQIWQYSAGVGESVRDTLGVQIRNLALVVTYLVVVVLLDRFGFLSIRNLFWLNIALYFLFAALYGLRIHKMGGIASQKVESFRLVLGEFFDYCWPLILASWVGVFYSFADYWLLQNFGGSVQQGYYAISGRFAAPSLLVTTSILQIFWKEIAEAHSLGNIERVRQLYANVSQCLYFMGAVISCILIPFSQEILVVFLGSAFQDAWLPLSILLCYPIHQSIGQITSIMLTATGKTKTAASVGIVFMVISIPVAYMMLASKSSILPGFQLGALGLALKMVSMQVLSANIMAFFVARYLGITFNWSHQIFVLFLLMPTGLLCKIFSQYVLHFVFYDGHVIFVFTLTCILYLSVIVIVIRYAPSLAGLNLQQIQRGSFLLRGLFKGGAEK